jgi:putative transcriptional regulator
MKSNLDLIRNVKVKPVKKISPRAIVKLRQSLGLNQARFAWFLGVTEKTILNWETGRTTPNGPSFRLMELLKNDPEEIRIAICRS